MSYQPTDAERRIASRRLKGCAALVADANKQGIKVEIYWPDAPEGEDYEQVSSQTASVAVQQMDESVLCFTNAEGATANILAVPECEDEEPGMWVAGYHPAPWLEALINRHVYGGQDNA